MHSCKDCAEFHDFNDNIYTLGRHTICFAEFTGKECCFKPRGKKMNNCKNCFHHYYDKSGDIRCIISNNLKDCNFFKSMEIISSNTNINNKVKYIVHLKDIFKMPGTVINKEFCGSPVRWIEDRVVFDLNSSYDAQIIIPYNAIDWMAPSKIIWDELCSEIDKKCAEGFAYD